MTAVLQDGDVYVARQLLQGYCAASEHHTLTRLLYYHGPDQPAGFKKVPDLDKTPHRKLWNDLHQFFTKQSFIVQVRYPTEPSDFGQDAAAKSVNLDQVRGSLRWGDIPDPLPSQAFHIQRKMLEIHNQDRLIHILTQNRHIFKGEFLEEKYTWWQNGVQFSLERDRVFPGDPSGPNNQGVSPLQAPRTSLPPLDEIKPMSSNWMLHVSVNVPDPTPERMAAAAAALAAVRADLRGNFTFQQFDRRIFDTRYRGAPVSNMPLPLPQVVPIDRA
jgi:mediator of RNA polymerase II transcription subunit 18